MRICQVVSSPVQIVIVSVVAIGKKIMNSRLITIRTQVKMMTKARISILKKLKIKAMTILLITNKMKIVMSLNTKETS